MQARHSEGGQLVELERIVGDFHQYLGARLFGQTPAAVHRERRTERAASSGDAGTAAPPSVLRRNLRPLLAFAIASACIALIEGGLAALAAQPAARSDAAPASRAAVFDARALQQRYVSAWRSRDGRFDVDALAKLYAADAGRVFFDAFTAEPTDWSFSRAWPVGEQPLVEGLRSFALVPLADPEVVALADDRVLTTGSYRMDLDLEKDGPQSGTLRQTALWERRGEHWVMTHEHLSVPLEELE